MHGEPAGDCAGGVQRPQISYSCAALLVRGFTSAIGSETCAARGTLFLNGNKPRRVTG